jgi:anthranilate synthase component 1
MLAELPLRPKARAVQRRLPREIDPLSAFAELSPEGRADTALFEAKDGLCLLMPHAAVRAECRSETVSLRALTANGESLLRQVQAVLADRVTSAGADQLSLGFPPSRSLDSEARLLAPSPLQAIRSLLRSAFREGEHPFAATALGVIAFDYAALGENLPDNLEDPLGFPDYVFWIPESLLVFERGAQPLVLCTAFSDDDPGRDARNHHDAVARLTTLVEASKGVSSFAAAVRTGAPSRIKTDLDDGEYAGVVRRLKEEIAAGEVYQIVPSRTFRAPCPEPLHAYAALRTLEPSSYRFFVRGADFTLFGASPETSVRIVREDGWNTVEVRPIAGTRPRGATPDEDDRIEAEMRLDHKEIAEHMMLVDLARNDVARISIPGTRRVARLLTVERYSRVMHLVSSVTGRLGIGFDALDALAACLNVGTLTGAPKIRATELLRQTERTKRGPYGGAVGWLNGAGLMDTAVVIRSALVRDGVAYVRAGAGIVHDSDPQAEADETRRKASALLSVLGAGASR